MPVRNGGPALSRLIDALEAQTLPREQFEVIIADDGSTDGAVDALSSEREWLRVTPGPPRNAYYARNRAVALARGEVLAFTDADCRPAPDWLASGLAALEQTDLVAGRVRIEVPWPYTAWTLLDLGSAFDQERFVPYGWAVTANLLVGRSLFDELGGFDESLPSGGDFDFTARCVAAGRRLSYQHEVVVTHPSRNTAKEFLGRRWRTEHARALRLLRNGELPLGLRSARAWLPLFGIGTALRYRHRIGNNKRRLAELGIPYRLRDELRTFPLRAIVVPYWTGIAQVAAWLRFRLARDLVAPSSAQAADALPDPMNVTGEDGALAWRRDLPEAQRCERPLTSVIVPVRNGRGHLPSLIDALREQTLDRGDFEVIIADDGSTDGSTDELREGGWLRLAPGPPRGRSAARNRGAGMARGQILAFTDADCRPQPDWLENGLAALEHSDLVAGRVRPVVSGSRSVWALLDMSSWLDLDRFMVSAGGMSANLFMQRSLFEHVGGFDETLPSEDVDLVVRCESAGAQVRFTPSAVVEHPVLEDARAFLRKVWRRNRGAAVFAHRHGQRPNRLRLSAWLPSMILIERRRLGLAMGLDRRLAREMGIELGFGDQLRTMPLRVMLAYWAGAAQLAGWLTSKRTARAGLDG